MAVAKAAKHTVRMIIPDSHGNHIDLRARDAAVRDAKALRPDEIVFLGDHVDCGGVFSAHQRSYTAEMTESYTDDCAAANEFLDLLQAAAPNARGHYLEGNHEAHVERYLARNMASKKDADDLLADIGPQRKLRLKERGIRYYRTVECYQHLTVPGTIKLGKCYFTHGISHSKNAASVHLARFGANVVFGHVHRAQSVVERTVTSEGFGAWCPGTLAALQPLYRHTAPTSWSHGYAVQLVNQSTGTFLHINVPIVADKSLLMDLAGTIATRKKAV